ncbi:MAG: hypothetical protein JW810_03740 [Sedimentisphaerales bacterium]|nr:hypothetical protein [Sedimentisphaerales bacterium]
MAYAPLYKLGCWLLNLFLYILLTMFFQRLQSGQWLVWSGRSVSSNLIEQVLTPLNIFHYPAYIAVLGLLLALVCAVPILTAQMYNILYALPFVLVALFLGTDRIFALCLLVSCLAVSFEPLRFKSKFVSAVLCLVPELLYWAIFSGPNPQTDPLRWAVMYAPWSLAFLASVMIFGIVLAIGHFVRYRPGVLTPTFGLILAGVVIVFHVWIGMTERDFQAYVFSNRPDRVQERFKQDITALLEEEKAQRLAAESYLNPQGVENLLQLEWQAAFSPAYLQAQTPSAPAGEPTPAQRKARNFLLAKWEAQLHIERFIQKYPHHRRVADSLYYQALLEDLKPDVRALRNEKRLRLYDEIPSENAEPIWRELLRTAADHETAIEARWRIATLAAAALPETPAEPFQFDASLALLQEAKTRCQVLLDQRQEQTRQEAASAGWLLDMSEIFQSPQPTLTRDKLLSLYERIGLLQTLLDKENRQGHVVHERRLAEFVRLDPQQLDYETRLKALTLDAPQPDPLIDNIELAQAMLIAEIDSRRDALTQIVRRYPERDGGIQAMLQLAQVLLEKYNQSDHDSDRHLLRTRGQELLQRVITLRPDSFLAHQAQQLLGRWPGVLEAKTQQTDPEPPENPATP